MEKPYLLVFPLAAMAPNSLRDARASARFGSFVAEDRRLVAVPPRQPARRGSGEAL
jgi:hypothetical protein